MLDDQETTPKQLIEKSQFESSYEVFNTANMSSKNSRPSTQTEITAKNTVARQLDTQEPL